MQERQQWHRLGRLDRLREEGRQVVKLQGCQIALFDTDRGLFACANRCPHEGYPLIEGAISSCRLTCNWHSWTFDLATGETLKGGDRLRVYPVEDRDGEIWIDIADPPKAKRISAALGELEDALPGHDYDRIARSLVRLEAAGGDGEEALIDTIRRTHDHFEYGTTHATAAAADWLTVRHGFARDQVERTAAILEAVGHFAWDAMGGRRFPFHDAVKSYDEAAFLAAIEAQDEDEAVARIRGGLGAGMTFADLESALTKAALSHFAGFGHAMIYLYKTRSLIERLGDGIVEPVLLPLVRYFISASRDDLVPEFRAYGPSLAAWDGSGSEAPGAEDLSGLGIKAALNLAGRAAGDITALYQALLGAAALNLLRFDEPLQHEVAQPISRNVGWLDFTHAITFANAVRAQCTRFPDLWPQGLLQMACFVGRNAAYLDGEEDWSAWRVDDVGEFLAQAKSELFDHQEVAYIYSAHRLKTTLAVEEELGAATASTSSLLVAALNRYLSGRVKRKHVRRTAHQALDFVANEG